MEPTVAAVIASYNAEQTLGKCIDSLLGADYPHEKLHVVVVDDGSTDGTRQVVARYADRVTLVETERNIGPSQARNLGVRHSAADYVCFTDADCTVARDWVRELLAAFKPNVGAVGGTQLCPTDETPFGRVVQKYLETVGFVGGYTRRHRVAVEVDHNPSCNVMYKREVFDEVGGFLAGLWPGEDVEFALRVRALGYRIFYNPRARVYHYRPRTLREFSRMMRRYGQWSGGYLTRRHGFFRPLSYEPLAVAAGLLGALIVWRLLGLMALGVVILAVALIIVAIFWHGTRRFREAFLLVMLFAVTLVVWNAGFCAGLFSEIRCGDA